MSTSLDDRNHLIIYREKKREKKKRKKNQVKDNYPALDIFASYIKHICSKCDKRQ